MKKIIKTIFYTLLLIWCGCDDKKSMVGERSIIDSRDGQVYNIVVIGDQIWMAENLNYAAKGSFCSQDDKKNCAKYGRLYSNYNKKSICPKNFRVPTFKDWERLFLLVGAKEECKSYGYEGEPEDACDYLEWKNAINILNSYGFNIQYGGEGYGTDIGERGHYIAEGAREGVLVFYSNGHAIDWAGNGGQTGTYSMRCIWD